MALTQIFRINEHCAWALWRIEENTEDLKAAYNEHVREAELQKPQLDAILNQRLAARMALKSLFAHFNVPFEGIVKDERQKPEAIGFGGYISIAHTKGWAAAICHMRKPVGIDLEPATPRIARIVHKFMTEPEKAQAGNDYLRQTIVWCAKEALYKIYGRKQLIFKEHLHVQLPPEGQTAFGGHITQHNRDEAVSLAYTCLDQTIAVWGILV